MPPSSRSSSPARSAVLLGLLALAPACAFEEAKPGPSGEGGSAVQAPLAGRWCAPEPRGRALEVDGHRLEAAWTFPDEADGELVIEVTRRLDGLVFERQRWTLDADGGLTARLIETPDALDEDLRALAMAHPLDDHQALVDDDTWAGALVRTGAGCDRLPTSYGHGYPAAEGWYVAGASDAGATAASALGWYGHGGDEAGAPFATARSLVITLRYDEEERLVEERLDRGAAEGGPHDLLRSRAFEDGALVIDRMERWSPTPKEDVVRVMRFTAAGSTLFRRTLTDTWETALETRWIPAPRP